jgi:hypothetical protein
MTDRDDSADALAVNVRLPPKTAGALGVRPDPRGPCAAAHEPADWLRLPRVRLA